MSMDFWQRRKAIKLLGKKVRVKKVESPDIIGELFSVDKNGFCMVSGNVTHILNVNKL